MSNEPVTLPMTDCPGLVALSPAMQDIIHAVRRAAATDASVLFLGEPGTGKQFLAAALHRWSGRRDHALVRIDCAAPSAGERIAEQASHASMAGGTFFLNDLPALSPAAQVQVLRWVQAKKLEGAGSSTTSESRSRFIAAGTSDLYAEVAAGRFRADLFWLLNVIPISVPPLRRRREDIGPLAELFLSELGRGKGRQPLRIAADALVAMQQYAWPGNVHELKSYMERTAVMIESNVLGVEALPAAVRGQTKTEMSAFRGSDTESLIAEIVQTGIADPNGAANDLHARIVNPVERELIVQVMRQCNQVQKKAADRLGMNRNTLHKKMKEYGIE